MRRGGMRIDVHPENRVPWRAIIICLLAALYCLFYWRRELPWSYPDVAYAEERPATTAAHAEIMAEIEASHGGHENEVLLLGDSITYRWQTDGLTAYRESALANIHIVNAGVSGDKIQNVLWRLEHGLLAKWKPLIVVLLIGTNNLPYDSAEDIVKGIREVLRRIYKASPETSTLLCSIPPWVGHEAMNAKIEKINDALALLHESRATFWDWAAMIRRKDGSALPDGFIDQVHLSPATYRVWASLLATFIRLRALPPFLGPADEDGHTSHQH